MHLNPFFGLSLNRSRGTSFRQKITDTMALLVGEKDKTARHDRRQIVQGKQGLLSYALLFPLLEPICTSIMKGLFERALRRGALTPEGLRALARGNLRDRSLSKRIIPILFAAAVLAFIIAMTNVFVRLTYFPKVAAAVLLTAAVTPILAIVHIAGKIMNSIYGQVPPLYNNNRGRQEGEEAGPAPRYSPVAPKLDPEAAPAFISPEGIAYQRLALPIEHPPAYSPREDVMIRELANVENEKNIALGRSFAKASSGAASVFVSPEHLAYQQAGGAEENPPTYIPQINTTRPPRAAMSQKTANVENKKNIALGLSFSPK